MHATKNALFSLSDLAEEYKAKIRLGVFVPIIEAYTNACPTKAAVSFAAVTIWRCFSS